MKYSQTTKMSARQWKEYTQSEHELQANCVAWFRVQYPKLKLSLFAVPNGAFLHGQKQQRIRQWKKLEREGAVKGVADLFLAIPSGDYAGLFIEMKTKKGVQRDSQKEFEKAVLDNGYGYCIPRKLEQFREIVTNYLGKGIY